MAYLDFLWAVAQALNVFWIAFLKFGKPEPTKASATPMTESSSHDDSENVRAVYAALVSKRTNYELMLWQAPMISLTAQAFLLQIALGKGEFAGPKIVSGMAATLIGLASWQLFNRHSAVEKRTSIELEEMEKKHFSERAHGPSKREIGFLADTRSKPIWSFCLLLISFVGLIPLLEPVLKILFPAYW